MDRISPLEDSLGRIDGIQEQVQQISTDLANKAAAKDPNKPVLTHSDLNKWNNEYAALLNQHTEQVKQLQVDLFILDGAKLKLDILSLKKACEEFVPKVLVANMEADVKKIRIEIADNSFEVQTAKDMTLKLEKALVLSEKQTMAMFPPIKDDVEKNKQSISQQKKQMTLLDEKIKSIIKNAALSGNTSMGGGNIVQEIEDSILKIKQDMEEQVKYAEFDKRTTRNMIDEKVAKNEIKTIEESFSQQVSDAKAQLDEANIERNTLRQNINGLNKKVKNLSEIVIAIKAKELEPDTGMFTKRSVTNCASCEKNITNLLVTGADHQNWNKLPFREPNERIARVSALLFDQRLCIVVRIRFFEDFVKYEAD